MATSTAPKKRRPRRSTGGGRRSSPERTTERDSAKQDREFKREIRTRIQHFLRSDDEEYSLEPMNSYRRHLVHDIAKEYQLDSESRGDEPERYICLIKTPDTLDADAVEEEPEEPETVPEEEAAPEPEAEPEADTRRAAPSGKAWDYGEQTFSCNPGDDGIRIALKKDGSVEMWREAEKKYIIADRMVKSRHFRVRQGKIVVPDDPEW